MGWVYHLSRSVISLPMRSVRTPSIMAMAIVTMMASGSTRASRYRHPPFSHALMLAERVMLSLVIASSTRNSIWSQSFSKLFSVF